MSVRCRSVLLAVVGLAAGCASLAPLEAPSQHELGSLRLSSRQLGQITLEPTSCLAGDRQLFLGADFVDASRSTVLRLVVDPLDGPAVRVFSSAEPFDKAIVFRRADCAVFHFSLDTTGWRVNDVNDYRVTLQLDCDRDGETLKGSAAADHCH